MNKYKSKTQKRQEKSNKKENLEKHIVSLWEILKFNKLVIPKDFNFLINLLDLTDKEKELLMRMVNMIAIFQTRKKLKNYFVNIHHDVWKQMCQVLLKHHNYKKYLDILADTLIDINLIYSAKRFTMSFRFKDVVYTQGFTTVKLPKKKRNSFVKNVKNDMNDFAVTFTLEQYNKYVLIDNQSIETTPKRLALIETYYDQILNNKIFVKRGKNVKRLFHPFICCPKEGKNIERKDGQLVWNYDIKSAYPSFLTKFITNQQELKLYKKYLKNDIYTEIINFNNLTITRRECKEEMMRYVNGGNKNIVHNFYKSLFPSLDDYIITNHESLGKELQNLESSIMVDACIKFCMKHDYDFLSQHDGWLGLRQQSDEIIKFVILEFEKLLNYRITITEQCLTNPIEEYIITLSINNKNTENIICTNYICGVGDKKYQYYQ